MNYGEQQNPYMPGIQLLLTFLVYLPILISCLIFLAPRKFGPGKLMSEAETPELIRTKIPSLKKTFCCSDVQLQTYLAQDFDPIKPTIIFIHGHGSSFITNTVKHKGPWVKIGKELWKKGYNVFGIDMRNHGGSDIALPFAFGNIEKWDVRTAIEYVRKMSSAPIFLHGSSLGTTHSILALGTFTDLPISGLIIESAPAAFDTKLFKVWVGRIGSCVKYIPRCALFPIVFWNRIVLFFLSGGVCLKHPKNVAKNIQCDVLHLHGKKDGIVPFSAAESLTNEFKKRHNFYSYEFIPYNGGHIQAPEAQEFNYLNLIEQFIENTCKKKENNIIYIPPKVETIPSEVSIDIMHDPETYQYRIETANLLPVNNI